MQYKIINYLITILRGINGNRNLLFQTSRWIMIRVQIPLVGKKQSIFRQSVLGIPILFILFTSLVITNSQKIDVSNSSPIIGFTAILEDNKTASESIVNTDYEYSYITIRTISVYNYKILKGHTKKSKPYHK